MKNKHIAKTKYVLYRRAIQNPKSKEWKWTPHQLSNSMMEFTETIDNESMLPGIGIGVSAESSEDWSWWTADQKATNLKFEDQAANTFLGLVPILRLLLLLTEKHVVTGQHNGDVCPRPSSRGVRREGIKNSPGELIFFRGTGRAQ
jgi:hypothetical protein